MVPLSRIGFGTCTDCQDSNSQTGSHGSKAISIFHLSRELARAEQPQNLLDI